MTPGEKLGLSEDVAKEVQKLTMAYMLAEGVKGANEEARLCRKRNEDASWEACHDLEEFARTLAIREKEQTSNDGTKAKLKIRVYFAESDILSGEGGQKYLDKCWKQDGVADGIDYESFVLAGTNHDSTIFDFKRGALKRIFKEVKETQT